MNPIRARRLLLLSGRPLAWTGATWALDGSGRAYNTPTLGTEMLADGGMENWTTTTNLANWTENPSGTSTVNQESSIIASGSYACRLDVDASNSIVSITSALATAVGTWYTLTCMARGSAGGQSMVMNFSAGAEVSKSLTTAYAQQAMCSRATATSHTVLLKRGSAPSGSIYFDSATLKAVSLPTTLATVAGSANNQTAAAKIHTLTTGTQAGVVSLLDSASNPQNFLIGYHDGTNVRLDKRVGGTYTNLITTAVAFSSLAQIEIRRPSGNTFQLWYNGAQRGVDQTVSDAGIINNTRYGLFSTFNGNLFSEFSLGGAVIPFRLPGA